jgi:TM2 domain-containing membrane protein YozV
MSNRKQALLVALIFLPTVFSGLHRFYIGDKKTGILAILFFWLYVGFIITLVDIVRFLRMSDEEFDAKYTVAFQITLPLCLSIITPLLIIVGGVGLFLKDKVMCLPNAVARECIFVTEGDNILNARGTDISREFAWAIETFPPYILGLAGICILGLIVISSNRNAQR